MSRGRYYLDPAGAPLGGSGVLIDVTEARLEGEDAEATAPGAQTEHPVLRLSKHALALRKAIDDLDRDFELRMKADELLTAIGFAIARLIAPSSRSLNGRSASLHEPRDPSRNDAQSRDRSRCNRSRL